MRFGGRNFKSCQLSKPKFYDASEFEEKYFFEKHDFEEIYNFKKHDFEEKTAFKKQILKNILHTNNHNWLNLPPKKRKFWVLRAYLKCMISKKSFSKKQIF